MKNLKTIAWKDPTHSFLPALWTNTVFECPPTRFHESAIIFQSRNCYRDQSKRCLVFVGVWYSWELFSDWSWEEKYISHKKQMCRWRKINLVGHHWYVQERKISVRSRISRLAEAISERKLWMDSHPLPHISWTYLCQFTSYKEPLRSSRHHM